MKVECESRLGAEYADLCTPVVIAFSFQSFRVLRTSTYYCSGIALSVRARIF